MQALIYKVVKKIVDTVADSIAANSEVGEFLVNAQDFIHLV